MIYKKSLNISGNLVDFGLPSGNLWADRNLGAVYPNDPGYYFAWGEINPKPLKKYNEKNYSSKTFIDTAKEHLGDNWRVPSLRDFEELIDHSDNIEFCEKYIIFQKNEKSILIPRGGYYNGTTNPDDPILDSTEAALLWTSNEGKFESNSRFVILYTDYSTFNSMNWFDEGTRFDGLNIRPVWKKD